MCYLDGTAVAVAVGNRASAGSGRYEPRLAPLYSGTRFDFTREIASPPDGWGQHTGSAAVATPAYGAGDPGATSRATPARSDGPRAPPRGGFRHV